MLFKSATPLGRRFRCVTLIGMEKASEIRISVTPYLHDGGGRYVFGLRTEQCRDEHHRWEPVGGGGVEPGETLEEAFVREVTEEVGATPFAIEFLGFREVFREHEGQQSHWIAFDFRAQVDPAMVQIMEPLMCAELRWCTLDALPLPLHSQFSAVLKKYKNRL